MLAFWTRVCPGHDARTCFVVVAKKKVQRRVEREMKQKNKLHAYQPKNIILLLHTYTTTLLPTRIF